MQTRVAVMAVIVEDDDAAEKLNAVLHHYGEHIKELSSVVNKAFAPKKGATPNKTRNG